MKDQLRERVLPLSKIILSTQHTEIIKCPCYIDCLNSVASCVKYREVISR